MKVVVWILVGLMGLIGVLISVDGVGSFEPGKAFSAAIIGVVLGLIYFIPAFIAMSREHPNQLAIVVLNVVAGWTFLGWVGGLVWSLVGAKQGSRLN